MRFVIFGAGAIGGVVGARLHQSGSDVLLIARGAHHDAIASSGLRLETPLESVTLPIPVARDPAGAQIRPGDVVLLCVKGQDTWPALVDLRAAAPAAVPIVCMQNGVENERVALRLFDDVVGCAVLLPAEHVDPGVVAAFGTKVIGSFDVGRYPSGVDGPCVSICDALNGAGFECALREDVMRFKHAKLIVNLANAVQAVCGEGADSAELVSRVRAEGEAVLRAAGIAFDAEDVTDVRGRWERWGVRDIAGRSRGGGSTWQSVARGTGRVETDFLNGEIVLHGRLNGVPTPANALMQDLAAETARDHHMPGWLTPAQVLVRLEAAAR